MSTRETRKRLSSQRTVRRLAEAVGYGRPPRAHQFKPGQSGNPRGRPRGAKNEATLLRAILNRKLTAREGGKPGTMTVLEAILLRFTEDALKGNPKSAAFMLNRYAAVEAGGSPPNDELGADDREVLEAFARRFEAQLKQSLTGASTAA